MWTGNNVSFGALCEGKNINGAGGDGGVESYANLSDTSVVGVQAKWFLEALGSNEIGQIRSSIRTAKSVRSRLNHYIVAVPRDLASRTAKTKTSEEDRWSTLIKEMKNEFPDLYIELWKESRLLRELQRDESGGIRRYWFTKTEISLEAVNYQFQKAKTGWLSQRYISSLHGQGIIHGSIQQLLGTRASRIAMSSNLSSLQMRLHRNQAEIEFSRKLFEESSLIQELSKVATYLDQVISNIERLLECLKSGQQPQILQPMQEPDVSLCLDLIDKQAIRSTHSINRNDLIRTLKELDSYAITRTVSDIHSKLMRQRIIFVGDAGTGKTHGVAYSVESYLEQSNRPAIIVQAKRFGSTSNWRDILTDTLGLSNNWGEEEIWTALDACAIRCDVRDVELNRKSDEVLNEPAKVLLCIDGLDESTPYKSWIERVGELDTVLQSHPRMRLVITGRPYVFQDTDLECEALPSEGDSPVHELFDQYIDQYNIQFDAPGEYLWLKWSIKTPFALRLFCEKHRESKIQSSTAVHTLTEQLLADKIDKIDDEMNLRLGRPWGRTERVALRILLVTADYCIENISIERSDLCKLIVRSQAVPIIDDLMATRIIDFLVENGILYELINYPTRPLEISTANYEIATQPLTDYLFAIRLVDDIVENNSIDLTETFVHRESVLRMAGIILLQDYDWMVGERSLWVQSLSTDKILDLRLFVLSHVTPNRTVRFTRHVKSALSHSMPICRRLVNDLIAKVARIPEHPLGPTLLHEVLLSKKTVAERDVFWSLPQFMRHGRDQPWSVYGACISSDTAFSLISSDRFDGLPLIYAWQLTVVDNRVRNECRKQLTSWGITNPREFIAILRLTYMTNDPQMKEDLMSCAMGIASELSNNSDEFLYLTEWVCNEIFPHETADRSTNAVIRAAGRAIVEKAYYAGMVSSEQIKLARPSYELTSAILPLDLNAVQSEEMYSPVTSDLAWYVIKTAYQPFFFTEYPPDEDSVETEDGEWDEIPINLLTEAIEEGLDEDQVDVVRQAIVKRQESLKFKESLTPKFVWDDEAFESGYRSEVEAEQEIAEKQSFDQEDLDQLLQALMSRNEADPSHITPEYSVEARALLRSYEKTFDLDKLTPHQLTLGFTLSYIQKMGWNEKDFYGQPNGGKAGEVLGIDVAIMRQYGPSTHGSQSPVMQFSEKYTWLAVHEIMGYFADCLPFQDFEDITHNRVPDYFLMIDVPNPAQELFTKPLDEIRSETGWFLPNELCPEVPGCQDHDRETIERWITSAQIPDFYDWIVMQSNYAKRVDPGLMDDWLCLYNFSAIQEPKTKSESVMWISSALVSNADFELLQQDCLRKAESLVDLCSSHTEWSSSPKTDTYVSPAALCWMHWIEDRYTDLPVYTYHQKRIRKYAIFKTVSDVTYDSVQGGEISFSMPSKLLRNSLDITTGDGWKYRTSNGTNTCFYAITGTAYRESQTMLYAKLSSLRDMLQENDMRMFWVIRLLRQPSIKAYDLHEDLHCSVDRTWIAYLVDGELVSHLVIDEKR